MSSKDTEDRGNKSVLVRVPEDLLAEIDAARREEQDPPTRPEMIRRLVREGLKSWTLRDGE